MKKTLIQILWHFLTLACMVVIFLLSSQDGQSSSQLSQGFIRYMEELLVIDISSMPNIQQIIRKGAHMFIYFVLGLVTMGTMYTYKIRLKPKILITLSVVFIYAITDEIHQIYVPGRSGSFVDVMIDTVGGFIGMMLMIGIMSRKRKNKI